VIKGLRPILAFFLSIVSFFTVQAQADTSSKITGAKAAAIQKTAAVSKPPVEYKHFPSTSAFSLALKNKSFLSTYAVVSVVDTVAGIPRKKTGIVSNNKLIVPFEYDSVLFINQHEFIVQAHIVTKRTYACNYLILDAQKNSVIDFKAIRITCLGNHLYDIHTATNRFLYNSLTKRSSATFDRFAILDSAFILLTTASEYQLCDHSLNDFISSPFKVLLQANDSTYNAVLYTEWDIYKHTGEKLFSAVRCDSIKASAEPATWDVYRNGNVYHRRYISRAETPLIVHTDSITYSKTLNISKLKYDTIKTMLRFDTVYYQSDNLLMYKKAGKYGYSDTIGNVKISHQYDTITAWHENMAAFMFKKKWGYLTRREELTVQPYYMIALPFSNGAAPVYDGKKWMFITKNGKNINSVMYDSIQKTISGKWYVFSKGLAGLCDVTGRELIPPVYEYLLDAGSDVYVFKKEYLYGLIGRDRTIICKPMYDAFQYDKGNNCLLLKQLYQTPLLFVIHK
jgi:hypothetical protein